MRNYKRGRFASGRRVRRRRFRIGRGRKFRRGRPSRRRTYRRRYRRKRFGRRTKKGYRRAGGSDLEVTTVLGGAIFAQPNEQNYSDFSASFQKGPLSYLVRMAIIGYFQRRRHGSIHEMGLTRDPASGYPTALTAASMAPRMNHFRNVQAMRVRVSMRRRLDVYNIAASMAYIGACLRTVKRHIPYFTAAQLPNRYGFYAAIYPDEQVEASTITATGFTNVSPAFTAAITLDDFPAVAPASQFLYDIREYNAHEQWGGYGTVPRLVSSLHGSAPTSEDVAGLTSFDTGIPSGGTSVTSLWGQARFIEPGSNNSAFNVPNSERSTNPADATVWNPKALPSAQDYWKYPEYREDRRGSVFNRFYRSKCGRLMLRPGQSTAIVMPSTRAIINPVLQGYMGEHVAFWRLGRPLETEPSIGFGFSTASLLGRFNDAAPTDTAVVIACKRTDPVFSPYTEKYMTLKLKGNTMPFEMKTPLALDNYANPGPAQVFVKQTTVYRVKLYFKKYRSRSTMPRVVLRSNPTADGAVMVNYWPTSAPVTSQANPVQAP